MTKWAMFDFKITLCLTQWIQINLGLTAWHRHASERYIIYVLINIAWFCEKKTVNHKNWTLTWQDWCYMEKNCVKSYAWENVVHILVEGIKWHNAKELLIDNFRTHNPIPSQLNSIITSKESNRICETV